MLKKYYVDIDGTVANTPNIDGVNRYDLSTPISHRIDVINKLVADGHHVTYWTARGASTGIDWSAFTKNQLLDWGCKFHECITSKPGFDIYVCDKALNAEAFFFEHDNEYGFDWETNES